MENLKKNRSYKTAAPYWDKNTRTMQV